MKAVKPIQIAVIGYGYWGPNVSRAISRVSGFQLAAIVDRDQNRRDMAARDYGSVKVVSALDKLLGRKELDAVVVATPAQSHFDLTLQALEAGCHVLVEKPLALSLIEAKKMVAAAREKSKVLMVDHTYLFNPGIEMLQHIVKSSMFGEKIFFESTRSNLGIFQPDVSVLWDLAVHDISILLYLFNELPQSVVATAGRHRSSRYDAAAFLSLEYESGFFAHISVSWLTPMKIRRTVVSGSQQTIVFDDSVADEKVKIYDASIDRLPAPSDLLQYRLGEVRMPRVLWREPLQIELEQFRDAISKGDRPRSSGEDSLNIIRILDAAQQSIVNGGAKTTV